MTRGNSFPVAWLALPALVWLSGAAAGQVWHGMDNQPPISRPVFHQPAMAELRSSGPGVGGMAAPSPNYGPLYGDAALGGYRPDNYPSPGLFPSLHQILGSCRHLGQPLERETWLYRPWSAGWFMGAVQGGPLIDDWVGQQQGFFGGYRFGWDQDQYWGGEMRFAFGSVPLYDSPRAKQAQWDADTEDGFAEDDPWRNRFDQRRDADLFQWDLSLLYYPWGDTEWRPYLMAGIGVARIRFMDRLSHCYDKSVFAMPLAVGLKRRCNDWLALRLEFADNIAFGGGSGFGTVHNASLTGGVEVRFGGSRRAYWPWNPGRHYW